MRMGQIDTVLFTRLNWEEIGGLPGMISLFLFFFFFFFAFSFLQIITAGVAGHDYYLFYYLCMRDNFRFATIILIMLMLSGMILTTSDTGMRALTVCGPEGVQDYITSTRFFLQRYCCIKPLSIKVLYRANFFAEIKEFKGNSPAPHTDRYMTIKPIVLDPNRPAPSTSPSEFTRNPTIAYIPSARKFQRLNIRKQNVDKVVSLMFSKRRQLTEYEELHSAEVYSSVVEW